MLGRRSILFLILIMACFDARSQNETFTVKKLRFCSDFNDEFGPVFYGDGIVYTSNRINSSISVVSSNDDKGHFKLYYADSSDNFSINKPRLFSKDLSSRLNDGPASFSRDRDTVYFTRNLKVEGSLRELNVIRNNLGIFVAVNDGDEWINIREFRFNNEWHNLLTPAISPDGRKLFFSSDRPGGYGGLDIYYCELKKGYWDEPVNLGPAVNTNGNESYPYMNATGELFFASDGHAGLGKKDIFVTRQKASGWYQPIGLDSPLNSEYDDFGIVTDSLGMSGFFSSGRGKTIDIYSFKANNFQFWFSEFQKEDNYCIAFSDRKVIRVDTLKLEHVWTFGNTTKVDGPTSVFCIDGPGIYNAKLDLVDRRSGKIFFQKLNYKIEVLKEEKPFINTPDGVMVNESFTAEAVITEPGGYETVSYYWDFGDGGFNSGKSVRHNFSKPGETVINLGLILRSKTDRRLIKEAVTKKIMVFANDEEKKSYLSKNLVPTLNMDQLENADNLRVRNEFSAEKELGSEAFFRLALISSKAKIPLTDPVFRRINEKYFIREVFDPGEALYTYYADQQLDLMSLYPAYAEMIGSGFKDAVAKVVRITDPAEKNLFSIVKNYDLLADINFDANNRLTTSAFIMLDQVVSLMSKYPQVNLEICVHSDNQGTAVNSQNITQFRAQLIMNHLINRGISAKRLSARGFGGLKPVNTSNSTEGRKLNRRIELYLKNIR